VKLSELNSGNKAIITKVLGRGAFRKRIIEMGFVKGKEVAVVKDAPLKDPIEYNIMGYEVSLRKSEAQLIEVVTQQEAFELEDVPFQGVLDDDVLKTSAKIKGKTINVALVGNPNSGKTTLFNYASGSHEHVGNYSGVTIDAKKAKFKQNGYAFNIVDLPGTYSLTAYSPEELYVRSHIFNEVPDVVVNVVDASNLERNLYLTTQLIDMDVKVVIALNMYDELKKSEGKLNYRMLGELIGIPIIPTISSKGKGIKELFDKIIQVYEDQDPTVRHIHINYGKCIEGSVRNLQELIKVNRNITDKMSSRFLAIKMLEFDNDAKNTLTDAKNREEILKATNIEVDKINDHLKEDAETLVTDSRYGFIAGALKETYKGQVRRRHKITELVDKYMTHKVLGFPIFLFFMFLMFFTTFELGGYPMDWIDSGVIMLNHLISNLLPDGTFKELITDGIIAGVGGVIIFLPNILILFLFISFMEDTGYMARAAFIMDKLMHGIGLHGKSFIPLIMGFGCNVPAIMGTRTIENKNDRILTILINPLMSCSARLPVYILIIGTVFPNNPSLILFSIYIIGILLAVIVAKIIKKTLFKNVEAPFVMELPPYRMPTLRTTFRHMWNKAFQYLKKMGGIILIASVIIWYLSSYPKNIEFSKDYQGEIEQVEKLFNDEVENNIENPDKVADLIIERDDITNKIILEKESEKHEKSYIGIIGKFIEPAIRPLGFDWKIGISLLTGIAAKEVLVSTIGVLYHAKDADEQSESLKEQLRKQTYQAGVKKGEKVFTPLVGIAFLLFVLIYFPCIAVIIAIKNETGTWKYAIFTIVYTTSLAWFVSFLVYQIGSLFI
jgi:ferrous iron transport protein B